MTNFPVGILFDTFPGNILIVGLAVWLVYLLLRRISAERYAVKNPEWVKAIFEQADPPNGSPPPPDWVQEIDAQADAFRERLIADLIEAETRKGKTAPSGQSYDANWDYQAGKPR